MFFGDCAEGIVRCGCRDNLVQLLLLRRVFAVGDQRTRVISLRACFHQRDFRKGTKAEHQLFAAEAVTKTPQLATARRHKEMQATSVSEFVRPVSGFAFSIASAVSMRVRPSDVKGLPSIVPSNEGTVTGRTANSERAKSIKSLNSIQYVERRTTMQNLGGARGGN